MGRITERFGHLKYNNEAEVSQNFVIPLLTEFLGYRRDEILPEHYFPSFTIPQNREKSISSNDLPPKAKPDYVVAIDGQDKVVVCDSKGPDESLDEYHHQLLAYCIALKTDLLLTTNGTELTIHYANSLVYKATSVQELDISFAELEKLISRNAAVQAALLERIQSVDLSVALDLSKVAGEEYLRRVEVALSDFKSYLRNILQNSIAFELPFAVQKAFDVPLRRLPGQALYVLRELDEGSMSLRGNQSLSYRTVLNDATNVPMLLIGESGIGKTTLLHQLVSDQVQRCLTYRSEVIPVIARLALCTQGRGVFDLIAHELTSNGFRIGSGELPNLLHSRRFLLLLDAFDEVLDSNLPHVERDIQLLAQSYRNCRLIITTRSFRIPRAAVMRRYEVALLVPDQIRAFAEMHLGYSAETFLDQLSYAALYGIASNTLLLTLLILLFISGGKLPRNRSAILQGVIDRIEAWDATKQNRFSYELTWMLKRELLTKLAYAALSAGSGYVLDGAAAREIIGSHLTRLEEHHQLPRGLSYDQAVASLAGTGFIQIADFNIRFWHHAFVEYFALPELADRLVTLPDYLDSIIDKPQWENALPLAIPKASSPEDLLRRVLERNVFIAARTALEWDQVEREIVGSIVAALVSKCNSSTRPIRQITLRLLRQLNGRDADARWLELLQSQWVDVQKVALVEVARRKLDGAREIVCSRLTWDVPAPGVWEGSSRTAVVEALGEFDDVESQLKIVSIWREKPDIFTTESCYSALIKLVRRGVLADDTKTALVDLLLSDDMGMKSWRIRDVLAACSNIQVANLLMEWLHTSDDDRSSRDLAIEDILASHREPAILQRLVSNVNDSTVRDSARILYAGALSQSMGEVPVDDYQILIRNNNCRIRAHGISGLKRFNWEQVKDYVLRAIHPPPLDESWRGGNEYAWVQTAAFEVMDHFDQLDLLLYPEHQPEYLYNTSTEALFNAIASKRLSSMIPLLRTYIDKNMVGTTEAVHAIWALADLGHVDQAQKHIEVILRQQLPGGWVVHKVVEGVHRLPAAAAIRIVDDVLAKTGSDDRQDGEYLLGLCIEALERVGVPEAVDRLARIVEATVDDPGSIRSERALRAIEFLAPKEREGWLLGLIEKHPQMGCLHRALDTLGVIGTETSLPLLEHYFHSNPIEHIRTICYWAIADIYRRSGKLWFNGEEQSATLQS